MDRCCETCSGPTERTHTLILGFSTGAFFPVGDPSSASDWNTWFNLPIKGTPFTSAVLSGDSVALIGGKNIVVQQSLFDAYQLTQINDTGAIIETDPGAFNWTLLTYVSMLGLRKLGVDTFSHCASLEYIFLPSCISVGAHSMEHMVSAKYIYLPKCRRIGTTVADNEVFISSINNNLILVIPASRMTCNGGSPDGDIAYLQANNTVTIVQV